MRSLVVAPRARARLDRAREWLEQQDSAGDVLLVGATLEAAGELIRSAAAARGAVFGWQRMTLPGLAWRLSGLSIASRGHALAPPLSREALCARAIRAALDDGDLTELRAIAGRPGFPRALGRTLSDLRMAAVGDDALDAAQAELAVLHRVYRRELDALGLADRAVVFREAAAVVARGGDGDPLVGARLLWLDAPLTCALEADLVRALSRVAPAVMATAPAGDERSIGYLEDALSVERSAASDGGDDALGRLQRHLFGAAPPARGRDDSVRVLSTPGESREAVEIVRAVLAEAGSGVPFDRMAVILRSPEQYGDHLDEAFERAGVPVHFNHGSVRPDPSGRALLSLLACKAEQLSARRFAEYLSLGVLPDPTAAGAPPEAPPPEERWAAPSHDMALPAVDDPDEDDAVRGLRMPRYWERLLTDAYVIKGRDRWAARLAGLRAQTELERDGCDHDDPRRDAAAARLEALASLESFALPLIDELARLPDAAPWSAWIDALSALASRALRAPARVLATLQELAPLGPVVARLDEVIGVIGPRLAELTRRPTASRGGKVLVASADEARGMSFEVVFVPGLAEKIFPRKVLEDPLALDVLRVALSPGLERNSGRIANERLALRLAVGAAERCVVLSYPRIDVDRSRPRVPSFYALEVLRAAEGTLPGFDELGGRAETGAAERMGWPAPRDPLRAIDEAEFDLAVLDELLHAPSDDKALRRGAARYLLHSNPHLARSLRFRARRWKTAWTRADGLVHPSEAARAALREHEIGARAYSPTALQHMAACPYRFFLSAIMRIAPRERIAEVEELDPSQRGRLIHEVLRRVLQELHDAGHLPLAREHLAEAKARARAITARTADDYHDRLAPAIERVWRDAVDEIEGDVCEWLERQALETSWVPFRFELGFGIARGADLDQASTPDPVLLSSSGLSLRGAIDLVERSGTKLRATDYKTGAVRQAEGIVHGGKSLQPALYALALEKLTGGEVEAGRLYHCTSRGGFAEQLVALDPATRAAADRVVRLIGDQIANAQLPAAPDTGACTFCDYQLVCGPREEQRTARKPKVPLLIELRSER